MLGLSHKRESKALRNLYSTPKIIRMAKSEKIRWERHVISMRFENWVQYLEVLDYINF